MNNSLDSRTARMLEVLDARWSVGAAAKGRNAVNAKMATLMAAGATVVLTAAITLGAPNAALAVEAEEQSPESAATEQVQLFEDMEAAEFVAEEAGDQVVVVQAADDEAADDQAAVPAAFSEQAVADKPAMQEGAVTDVAASSLVQVKQMARASANDAEVAEIEYAGQVENEADAATYIELGGKTYYFGTFDSAVNAAASMSQDVVIRVLKDCSSKGMSSNISDGTWTESDLYEKSDTCPGYSVANLGYTEGKTFTVKGEEGVLHALTFDNVGISLRNNQTLIFENLNIEIGTVLNVRGGGDLGHCAATYQDMGTTLRFADCVVKVVDPMTADSNTGGPASNAGFYFFPGANLSFAGTELVTGGFNNVFYCDNSGTVQYPSSGSASLSFKDSSVTIKDAHYTAITTNFCDTKLDHSEIVVDGSKTNNRGISGYESGSLALENDSLVKIVNCTFREAEDRGAIVIRDFSMDASSELDISGNIGNGLVIKGGSTNPVIGARIEDGAKATIANNSGYGIYNHGGAVSIDSAEIFGNCNGGILNVAGSVKLGDVSVVENGFDAEGAVVAQYGGGVRNDGGELSLGSAKVYNNHAAVAGDDIYSDGDASVTIGATGADWKLDGAPDCNDQIHSITGWFDDSEGDRWTAHKPAGNEGGAELQAADEGFKYHVEQVEPGTYTKALALKAAHGLTSVSYEFIPAEGSPELPQAIMDLLPKDDAEYEAGDSVSAMTPAETTIKVEGGTWTFEGYGDTADITTDADAAKNVMVGVWKFTPDSTPEPQPEPDPRPVPDPDPQPDPDPDPQPQPDNSKDPSLPQTGDSLPMGVAGGSAVVAALMMALGLRRRRAED